MTEQTQGKGRPTPKRTQKARGPVAPPPTNRREAARQLREKQAVARKDLKGQSGPGWHPEYAVDRRTALKMFTAWPAYARFAEDELGTITVGKRADLSAFSVDLMTAPEAAIPKGHAVLTVVDGEVVYVAPEITPPRG